MKRNGLTCAEAGKIGWKISKITRDNLYKKRIDDYLLNPNYCKQYNLILDYKSRNNSFCDHKCAAIFNNYKRIKTCLWCGEKVGKKFCGNSCQSLYHNYIKINKWLVSGKLHTINVPLYIKNFILKEQNFTCNHCKISQIWNGKEITFELEHIDGNSYNNERKNLEVLCPNCHSQTSTYKGKNVGNGRHFRRDRYKEGKSY